MATMPSASLVSNPASTATTTSSKEPMDPNPAPADTPLGQAVQILEKKVRNLEKRKAKLDGYRADHQRGKELNEDQKAAIAKYEEVIQNLDFARDLASQFKVLSVEEDKNKKKLQKKEQLEKAKTEAQRLAQILEIQDLLSLLNKSKVRNDFSSGENGAIQLTKEQLAMLDEFSKAVSRKTSTGNNYEKTVMTAAENFINALEGKQSKKIGKDTFKDLKSILETIKRSGYLQGHANHLDEDEERPSGGKGRGGKKAHHNGEKKDATDKPGHASPGTGPMKRNHQQQANHQQHQHEPVPASQLPQPQFVEQPQQQPHQQRETAFIHPSATSGPSPVQPTPQAQPPQQSHIDFFQDSQIDMESPHMDPAVVMVHSSAPPQQQQHHHHMMSQQQNIPPQQSFNSQMYAPPTTLASMQHEQMMYAAGQPQHHSPQPVQQQQEHYDYHTEELSKHMGQVGIGNNAQSTFSSADGNNFEERSTSRPQTDTLANIDDWDNTQAAGNGEDLSRNGSWRGRGGRTGGRGRGDGFRGERRGGYRGGRDRDGDDRDNGFRGGDRGSYRGRGGDRDRDRGGPRGGGSRGDRSAPRGGEHGEYRGGRGGGGAQSSRGGPRGNGYAPRTNGYQE